MAFTPDGASVIADRTRDGKTTGVVALPVAGGPPIVLAPRSGTVVGSGSPGTVTLAIDGSDIERIVEVSLTGQGGTRVVARDARLFNAALGAGGRLAYVRYTPDGHPEIRLTNPALSWRRGRESRRSGCRAPGGRAAGGSS